MPGTYPSGCPEPHVGDLWKVGAPAIDFRSPDMGGTADIRDTVNWYHTPGNPLFIPEAFHRMGAQNVFYAVGQHDAMGFSPFGIDSLIFTLEPGVLEEVRRRSLPMRTISFSRLLPGQGRRRGTWRWRGATRSSTNSHH